jgi:hypothetical protein
MYNPVILAYSTSDINQIRVVAQGFMGHTEMLLPISMGPFSQCWEKYAAGVYMQDAFPMLGVDQREFLISGITPQMDAEQIAKID